MIVIDGAETTHRDERNKQKRQKVPKLKKKVQRRNTRTILTGFLNSGFFNMNPILESNAYITGPKRYSKISIRIDGMSKQTQCAMYCMKDPVPACVEFCKLFDLIKENVSGVRTLEEPW